MGPRAFSEWGIDIIGPAHPPAHRAQAQRTTAPTTYLKILGVEAKIIGKCDGRLARVYRLYDLCLLDTMLNTLGKNIGKEGPFPIRENVSNVKF